MAEDASKKDKDKEKEDGEGGSGESEVKKPQAKKSEALWMMTFSDLSFILMCFFALLLSFTKPNKHQFEAVRDGMVKSQQKTEPKKNRNLKQVAQEIAKEIKKRKLGKVANVRLDSEGISVEFKDKLLFAPGSAQTNLNSRKTSRDLMRLIAKSPPKYKITIEGHTDDTPIGGRSKFRSNWDLSAARGVTLLNKFKRLGVNQDRMRIIAYADTKPKIPIKGKLGNKLKAARAANRRVVIRID